MKKKKNKKNKPAGQWSDPNIVTNEFWSDVCEPWSVIVFSFNVS